MASPDSRGPDHVDGPGEGDSSAPALGGIAAETEPSVSLVAFYVGLTPLALPSSVVEGIAPYDGAVSIPQAPPHVLGFCALGERVVVAVDTAVLLGISRGSDDARVDDGLRQQRLVIVRAGIFRAALVVDRVIGVEHLVPLTLHATSLVGNNPTHDVFRGEAVLHALPLKILDGEKLLALACVRPAGGA